MTLQFYLNTKIVIKVKKLVETNRVLVEVGKNSKNVMGNNFQIMYLSLK